MQEIRWNTECRRKLGYISVSRQLGTQISHRLELPPTRRRAPRVIGAPATAARQQLRPWSRSGPHQLQETKKGGYRDAPRRMNRWPRGQCQCSLRDTCGCEKDQLVIAPPKTCPLGGKRYVRNRVRVQGLAAVSQAIGIRKVPACCLFAKRGDRAKSRFLRLGPSPRQ